jgi:hypothetical protein
MTTGVDLFDPLDPQTPLSPCSPRETHARALPTYHLNAEGSIRRLTAMQETTLLLHVHAPHSQHDEAYLIGTREALLAVRAAIDQALSPTGQGCCEAMVTDGEHFDCIIIRDDRPWQHGWQERALPYTAESAKECSPKALWPWQTPESQRPQPPQKPAVDPRDSAT